MIRPDCQTACSRSAQNIGVTGRKVTLLLAKALHTGTLPLRCNPSLQPIAPICSHRQLHREVEAGVSRMVAVADAAAARATDEELEAIASARRAAWVQAVDALTAQKAQVGTCNSSPP